MSRCRCLKQALAAVAAELLTLDDVQRLLDELQQVHPALLARGGAAPHRAAPAHCAFALPARTSGCGRSTCGRCSRRWPPWPRSKPELHPLVEQVRAGLGRFLVHGYVRAAGSPRCRAAAPGPEGLPALLLDSEIEELVRESRRGAFRTAAAPVNDAPLAIEPELQRDIVQSVLTAKAQSPGAVVLCHSDVRRQVQRLLGGSPEALPVLAYSELPPSLPVLVMGHITPGT